MSGRRSACSVPLDDSVSRSWRFAAPTITRIHFAGAIPSVDRGSHARTQAVVRAVAQLRRGGLIIIAGDGVDTTDTLPTPCLGRAVRMARGPFALARICGAPLVPLLARCDHQGVIRITVGEPLDGHGSGRELETALAVAAGRWLETYLLTRPSQLRRCSLQWLLDFPPIQQRVPTGN